MHRTPTRMWADGPGALGAQASWLFVLRVLTRQEFRARYRAQALGMVWSVLNPIVMMAILSVVFTRVFRTSTADFPIFILLGLVVWNFVSTACNATALAFVSHSELIKRTVFPRQLLPLAVMLSQVINLLIEALVMLVMVPIFPSAFRLSWCLLLIPLVLAALIVLLAGVGLIVSVLTVLYRDVAYLVSTALSIVYWLTPLIYPIEIIPEPYQGALKLNPLTGVVNAIRGIVMHANPPSLLMWASIVLPAILVFTAGWLVFKQHERTVLDYV